jgi:hypothetical protein
MRMADGADATYSDADQRTPPGPPLLHLCGTDYGLLIHGLRKAPAAWGKPVISAVEPRESTAGCPCE